MGMELRAACRCTHESAQSVDATALSGLPGSGNGVCSPPPDSRGHWSGRGAAWLAHQTGGLGVAGSNPVAPTTLFPNSLSEAPL